MFRRNWSGRNEKDPAIETDREYRLWKAYSLLTDLQSPANRLLFKSWSPANPIKKSRLMSVDNSVAKPYCRFSPHPHYYGPRDPWPAVLLELASPELIGHHELGRCAQAAHNYSE
jgi:hypothetical protein